MIFNLTIGLSTMVVCLFLQSLILVLTIHYYNKYSYMVNNPYYYATMIVLGLVMLILILGNLAQISIWATVFIWLDEFSHFSEAFYHSAVNFATLGYGDFVMSDKHKLLGPLEAVNGILMVGVTTATLMATFRDSMIKTLRAKNKLSKYKFSE